jgi:hypothetical protein
LEPLKLIDLKEISNKYQTDYAAKGITSKEHLLTMLFVQLSGATSLRDAVQGMNVIDTALPHLGINRIPSKSGLAYANSRRDPNFFKEIFQQLFQKLSQLIPKKYKKYHRYKNLLIALDGTMIPLCKSMFGWAQYKTSKGAGKLHLRFV